MQPLCLRNAGSGYMRRDFMKRRNSNRLTATQPPIYSPREWHDADLAIRCCIQGIASEAHKSYGDSGQSATVVARTPRCMSIRSTTSIIEIQTHHRPCLSLKLHVYVSHCLEDVGRSEYVWKAMRGHAYHVPSAPIKPRRFYGHTTPNPSRGGSIRPNNDLPDPPDESTSFNERGNGLWRGRLNSL